MKKVILFILMLLIVFITIGCNFDDRIIKDNFDDQNKLIENNENEISSNNDLKSISHIRNFDILGLASYKGFESETNTKLARQVVRKNNTNVILFNDNNDELERFLYISYPYDYIKINSAQKYHFTINEDETDDALEPIITNCGLGDLEIVYATFTTYIQEQDSIIPSVSDILISIRGKKGFYTILSNSGSNQSGEWQEIFSSHKELTSSDVNKDFEPPIYSIMFTKKQDGNFSLSFNKKDNLASFSDFEKSSKYYFDGNDVETLTREVMYDVFNLMKLPEITTQVIVLSIDLDNRTILVDSNDLLELLIIDEYTETEDNLLSELKINDVIEITYDKLFEDYQPIIAYANTIKIVFEEIK